LTAKERKLLDDIYIYELCKKFHKLPSEVVSEPNINLEILKILLSEDKRK